MKISGRTEKTLDLACSDISENTYLTLYLPDKLGEEKPPLLILFYDYWAVMNDNHSRQILLVYGTVFDDADGRRLTDVAVIKAAYNMRERYDLNFQIILGPFHISDTRVDILYLCA